jgi:hypothetical protein
MTLTDVLPSLERDPAADAARAARGQARRAVAAWLFTGAPDPQGALTAADLDGSLLLGVPAGARLETGGTITVAIADAVPAGYRSLQTVRIALAAEPRQRLRFVNRHPDAEGGLSAGKLRLWQAMPTQVRLLPDDGGNVEVPADSYLLDPGADPELTGNEQANIQHQNADHRDISLQLTTQLLGQPEGEWLMTGLDPEGMDLRCGERRCRLPFPEAAFNRKGLGDAIKAYLKVARARLGIEWNP